jgi:hypothetical protein
MTLRGKQHNRGQEEKNRTQREKHLIWKEP